MSILTDPGPAAEVLRTPSSKCFSVAKGIVLFFQPVGAWVYFFAIKIRTFRLYRLRHTVSWESKVSLDELRYCVDRTPTVANRFALAERLMEKGAHGDAIPLLEAVLAVDPDYCPVLHALALCRLAAGC